MEPHVQASSSAFDDLADQIGQMMNEMRTRPFFKYSSGRAWQPSINLYEIDRFYIMCVDLAGMDREAFDVHTEGRVVVVAGERPLPQLPDDISSEIPEEAFHDCSVHLMEIESGTFRREVEIPGDVDMGRIEANYRSGYLWITMPKVGSAIERLP